MTTAWNIINPTEHCYRGIKMMGQSLQKEWYSPVVVFTLQE